MESTGCLQGNLWLKNVNAKIDEWRQKRKAKRPAWDRAFVSVPRAATGSHHEAKKELKSIPVAV